MAKEFLYRLIKPTTWKLLLKVFFYGFFLFLVIQTGFSPFSLLVFFAALLAIYFGKMPERQPTRASFWLLPAVTLLALYKISPFASDLSSAILLALSVSVFFLILALNHLLFKNRLPFYGLAGALIVFGMFSLYFSSPLNVVLKSLPLFLGVGIIFFEALEFSGFHSSKRVFLISALMSFVMLELGIVAAFLPLGFLNAAAYLTLIFVLIRDSFLVHLGGSLNRPFFIRELVFLVVFTVIIFSVSPWYI